MVDGVLIIDEVVPSDGGLYSCMAVGRSGNASRDVSITSKSLCLTLCFTSEVNAESNYRTSDVLQVFFFLHFLLSSNHLSS